jgi:hypothetical protein
VSAGAPARAPCPSTLDGARSERVGPSSSEHAGFLASYQPTSRGRPQLNVDRVTLVDQGGTTDLVLDGSLVNQPRVDWTLPAQMILVLGDPASTQIVTVALQLRRAGHETLTVDGELQSQGRTLGIELAELDEGR